jgi:hypothetical protein
MASPDSSPLTLTSSVVSRTWSGATMARHCPARGFASSPSLSHTRSLPEIRSDCSDEAIFPFLAIPPTGVVTDLHKLSTPPFEEVVVNYEGIAHVLTGEETRLELGTREARRRES